MRPLEVKELRGDELVEVVKVVANIPTTEDIELPFEGDSSMSRPFTWWFTSVVVVLFELHGGGVEHPEVLFEATIITISSTEQEHIDPDQGGGVIEPFIVDLPKVAPLLGFVLPEPLLLGTIEVH